MPIPEYIASTATKMIHAFVPVSRFNRGEAGKIIEEVKTDGIRVIVKNNAPECVMLTVEEYDRLIKASERPKILPQTKEAEEKRKAWLKEIRARASPPIPPSKNRKQTLDEIGPIIVDEDAVNELRRISMI